MIPSFLVEKLNIIMTRNSYYEYSNDIFYIYSILGFINSLLLNNKINLFKYKSTSQKYENYLIS